MNHSIWYLKSCSLLLNLGEMITPFPTAGQGSEDSGYEVVNHETKVNSLWCVLRLYAEGRVNMTVFYECVFFRFGIHACCSAISDVQCTQLVLLSL